MIKVKNVRAGIVIIADAGLKLAPGETVSVEKLTPQMQSAVDAGLLARIDGDGDGRSKPKNAPKVDVTNPEPTDSGPSVAAEQGTQTASEAEATDPGKDDGAPVEAAPGAKRGGK